MSADGPPPPPVKIRPATRRDIAHLLPLVQALATHHGDQASVTADSLTRDITGPAPWFQILLATTSAQPVGYAALTRIGRLHNGQRGIDLHHLYVAPAHRGQGIGRALVQAATDLARTLQAAYMIVGTAPDNRAAQALYRSLGFLDSPPGGTRFKLPLAPPDR